MADNPELDNTFAIHRGLAEFRDRQTELGFWGWEISQIKTQLKIMIGFTIPLNAFFISNDFFFLGTSGLLVLALACRGVFILSSLAMIILLSVKTTVRTILAAISVWVALSMSILATIDFTRPPGYIMNFISSAILVFAVYIFFPVQFWHKICLGIAYTCVNLSIIIFMKPDVTDLVKLAVYFAYLMVNFIGIVGSRNSNLRQRELFAALEREKETTEKIGKYAHALEKANSDLDACARIMANELKSGLTGIMGYTELLRGEKNEAPDDENKLAYLHKIEQAAQQLDATVDSLLDLSRSRKKDHPDRNRKDR
ncbi:MAG: hypothetical protein EHM28_11140 [Spirochaetaceae bacterium]|nr:MAG: hypothetical protein EHM28_11140 [Spirochaetaceae bacterium]